MSLRYKWPEDQIRAAIAPALISGEAKYSFANVTDAERFRFACYTLRRRKGIGAQLSFILGTNAEGEIEVLIKRTPTIELRRVKEAAS